MVTGNYMLKNVWGTSFVSAVVWISTDAAVLQEAT